MAEPAGISNGADQGSMLLNNAARDQLDLSRKVMREHSKDVIVKVLARDYGYIKEDERERLARQVMSAPRDSVIKIGNEEVYVDKFQNELGNSLLEFELAESIERINCGTTTQEEYFEWIEDGRKIIMHCNDGDYTKDDETERNDFIGTSFQREIELMTCIALYDNNRCEGAADKCNFLKQKLLKLREVRSAILNSTRDKADNKPVSKEEYERAVAYRKLLREMKEAELLKEQNAWTREMEDSLRSKKLQAGIYHGNDADINTPGFFYGAMVIGVTLQNDGYCYNIPCTNSPAERLALMKKGRESLEDVRSRLEILSGRRPPLKDLPEYSYDHIRNRAFTKQMFNEAFARENSR